MPKHKCTLTDMLKKEYPFLAESDNGKVLCTVCRAYFSKEHGGRSDITQHIAKKKHKEAPAAKSDSHKLTSWMTSQDALNERKVLAAQEELMAFHTMKHNHSFRSVDCTCSIIRNLFSNKFTCARTKCESIVVNVFAPFALREVLNDLREAKYVSVMVDSSNHSNLKLVPVLVRYFAPTRGIQVKVQNLTEETSEILVNHILSVLEKYKITEKVIAFCGDNCNTNFGGLTRKGNNNVFYKLNNSVKMNILGFGCAVHLIHNALQTSADMLPVDVESIINKIFQHFHIFTARVEELKTFCNFVEVEYKPVLGSVKTR